MKTYPKYKDSGVKWVGLIPNGWKVRKILTLAKEKKIKNVGNIEDNVLSLSYGNIIRKKNKEVGLCPEDFSTYQIVEKNDLIMRLTDLQNDHRSLRTGLVQERGIITSAYLCMKTSINPKFFHYMLHFYDIVKVYYSMGSGLRQSMNYADISRLFIPVPPLSEQSAIVTYLDEATAKMDKFVTKKEQEIVLLEKLKQRMIADAVTKGLDPNAEMVPCDIPWIKQIPKGWKQKSLREILKLVSEKNHPDENLLSVTREQGVIIRDIESKEENHNFIPEDLSGYKYVKKGQFVINKMKSWQGSYGVSNYNGIVSPAYYVCDLIFDNKEFFSLAIRSKAYLNFFIQYSKGIRVDQWDLSTIALRNIPFLVPSIEEQQSIVDYIKNKIEKINKLKTGLQQEIEKVKHYKQRLISDVVTGQIKVC